MVTLVRLFGIVIVVLGMVFLLNPKAMKEYISFWTKGKRIYGGGILSLLVSIIFLLAASQCRLAWFVVMLGILALIKGVVLLGLGPERLRFRFTWWQERSDIFLRLYSLLPIIIGILLIYSA